MIIYYAIAFAIFTGSVFSAVISKNKRLNIFDILTLQFLVLIAGLRYDVGTDYLAYLSGFRNINSLEWSFFGEPAFRALNYLTKAFVPGPDYKIFIVIAALTYIPIYLRIKSRNPRYFPVYLLFFILFGFYTMSFNVSRQWIAIALIFYGADYLIRGKKRTFCLFVLLAMLFHLSAILVLPFFLVAAKLKPSGTLVALSVIAGLTFALLGSSFSSIWTYIGLLSQRYQSYLFYGKAGIGSQLQLAVFFMLIILFLVFRKNLAYVDPSNDFYLSLVIMSVGLFIGGFVSVPIMRLATYLNVYIVFLLGDLIKSFDRRIRPIAALAIFFMLCIWFGFNTFYYGEVLPYVTVFNVSW